MGKTPQNRAKKVPEIRAIGTFYIEKPLTFRTFGADYSYFVHHICDYYDLGRTFPDIDGLENGTRLMTSFEDHGLGNPGRCSHHKQKLEHPDLRIP